MAEGFDRPSTPPRKKACLEPSALTREKNGWIQNTKPIPFCSLTNDDQSATNILKSSPPPSSKNSSVPPSITAILEGSSIETPVRPDFLNPVRKQNIKPVPFSLNKADDESKTENKSNKPPFPKSHTSMKAQANTSSVRKTYNPPRRVPVNASSNQDTISQPYLIGDGHSHVFTKPITTKVASTPIITPPTPPSPKYDVEELKRKLTYHFVNGNPYQIAKVLGEGGSSRVYQALDVNGDIRAIKEVSLRGLSSEVRESFIKEVQFLKEFRDCPYIIHLYEYEYRDASLHIVLEFGSTDISKMIKHSMLEPSEVLTYWKSMLRAIDAVHQKDVIHQDIKPANFVLVKGRIKLIDFGVANKIHTDATSVLKDNMFGTLNYMAPEALQDRSIGEDQPQYKVGRKADIWSAGILLYFMMYGRTPFQHISDPLKKMQAILSESSYEIKYEPYPNTFLFHVVKMCLTREPKLRPTIDFILSKAPHCDC